MTLKSPHRSGSLFTLCLIFALSVTFLLPLYHNHDHVDDYHHENSGGHALLHDGSDHDDLSENEQRNDIHLHIKKDIGRTDVHLRLKNSSDLYAVISSPVFAGNLSGTLVKHSCTLIFRSNPRTGLSGLSPPVA